MSSDTLISRPWLQCNGQQLKQLMQAGLAWLDANHEYINGLNVFPVPDGDSGTNMLLTMRSAFATIAETDTNSVSDILQAVAHGALMGARGNSGVILSQWLRGLADALKHKEVFNASDLVQALHEGTRLAYRGVQKPVEGTILTVMRETAEAVERAVGNNIDLHHLWTIATTEAELSVQRTPDIFPLLKKAGVVDSGGQGFAVILQGALKCLNGETITTTVSSQTMRDVSELEAEHGWGFDIQCLIKGENMDVAAIRAHIESVGESTLVVGDGRLIKVHTHAPTPGAILDYCISRGVVTDIIVENMEAQYQEVKQQQQHQTAKPPIASEAISGIATIAVVSGEGLRKVFESLNVSHIVSGGATMNPSVQDFVKAIDSVAADQVIVMPNDRNIMLAAQHASTLTQKQVRVVPSVTIPQGIAALMAYNFQANLDANAEAMKRALNTVHTGELTRAVRTVSIDGVDVREGQIIGLNNGKLTIAGDELNSVALDVMRRMNVEQSEIVTVYYGQEVSVAAAQQLAAQIRAHFNHLEVELVSGGQPHMHYILSAE
jgi:hypothetical protein